MKLNRIIAFSFANLWRNKFLSGATILIIALILFTFNVILSIHMVAQSGLDNLQEKVDIVLYLNEPVDPIKIERFIESIKEIESVEEIVRTSKEDALRNLLNRYPLSQDPFSKYGITNPLPGNINIITSTADYHENIIELAESQSFSSLFLHVEENSDNQKIIGRLIQLTKGSKKILISTLLIFLVASILIVSNAITLSIYHKREELNIMKLVGADPKAMRGPFILEGAVYGVCGFAIGMGLLFSFLKATELDIISFHLNVEILQFTLVELACCLCIGVVSSILSTERYLKTKK